jgi:hypothetical protein
MFPGVVPHSGHNPTSVDENWGRFFTIGPMSRYAEDLAPMLKVLANKNADELRLDEKVNIAICAYRYQMSRKTCRLYVLLILQEVQRYYYFYHLDF